MMRNLLLVFGLLSLLSCAGLDLGGFEPTSSGTGNTEVPLDEGTVARGLKEALSLGTERAVERLAAPDGYLANELIRIRLPEELDDMASALSKIGFSRQVDELEVAMNRAAEKSAREAVTVFVDAIITMSWADVGSILRGHETAATQFLEQQTRQNLRSRFQPIVRTQLNQVGLYRQYERLAQAYNSIPFVTRPAVDLDVYVTDRALDGLFRELGEEEKKIRRDPIARTTELLRRVFGRRR